MQGIKLITQMIFLLLYFIFPSSEETAALPLASHDVSFLYSSMGGFYAQMVEGPGEEAISVPAMKDMESEEQGCGSSSIGWEDEYETPVPHGNAMITSTKIQIVSGPYAGITLTADELDMLECVVHRETDGSKKHRKIIAEVVLNRVKSERFPNSVREVLTAPRQFSTISNYYTKKRPPDQITKDAVYEVLIGEGIGNSKGATYFYDPVYANPKSGAWFESDLTFCFALEGHRFFK